MKNQSLLLLTLWVLSAGLYSGAESLKRIFNEDTKQLVIDGIVELYEATQNLSDTTAKLAKENPGACGVLEFQQTVEVMVDMLRARAIEYAKEAEKATNFKALCLTFGMAVVDMNADTGKCFSLFSPALAKMPKRLEDEMNSAVNKYSMIFLGIMQQVNQNPCGTRSCDGKKNEV